MIPFNRPYTSPRAAAAMADAAERGHISGDGHYTSVATDLLKRLTGSRQVLLTTSCTHALEMTAMLLGVSAGDEVIMPSFTFVSTANAFALRGARPVFVDIRPDTFCIDERLIEAAITDRTRAIVVVHYAGVACEMDEIMAIAAPPWAGGDRGQRARLRRYLSGYQPRHVRFVGHAVVPRDEEHPVRRGWCAPHQRRGTLRDSRDPTGEGHQPEPVLPRPGRQVHVGVARLELPARPISWRRTSPHNSRTSTRSRSDGCWCGSGIARSSTRWASSSGFSFQHCPDDREHPAHLFALLAPDLDARRRFIAHLTVLGVAAVFHYVPLHSSPMGLSFGERHLPVTDDVSDRLVRLPLFTTLSDQMVDRVVEAVRSF